MAIKDLLKLFRDDNGYDVVVGKKEIDDNFETLADGIETLADKVDKIDLFTKHDTVVFPENYNPTDKEIILFSIPTTKYRANMNITVYDGIRGILDTASIKIKLDTSTMEMVPIPTEAGSVFEMICGANFDISLSQGETMYNFILKAPFSGEYSSLNDYDFYFSSNDSYHDFVKFENFEDREYVAPE